MPIQHPGHGRIDVRLIVRMNQCLRPVGRTHQVGGDMAVTGDVVGDVHQRKRGFAAQTVKNRRAVLHDHIGVGQLPGAFLHRSF
ncbi:hypothetical protein D3C74_449860 [compost metagenome]